MAYIDTGVTVSVIPTPDFEKDMCTQDGEEVECLSYALKQGGGGKWGGLFAKSVVIDVFVASVNSLDLHMTLPCSSSDSGSTPRWWRVT